MKGVITSAIMFGLVLGLNGCVLPFAGPERLTNQGGGDLLTAGAKIATNQLTSLTADEVQIIGDFINPQLPNVDLTLTDDEAAAIVEFLQVNNLNSLIETQQKISEAIAVAAVGGDASTVLIIPEGLTSLIERIGGDAAEDIWNALGELP
ncbi:MAG: hypothetical protein JXO22_05345 [Phycisphaerae bacterium]|nr:hypothetical protein [Phycisphaerae bacterium]